MWDDEVVVNLVQSEHLDLTPVGVTFGEQAEQSFLAKDVSRALVLFDFDHESAFSGRQGLRQQAALDCLRDRQIDLLSRNGRTKHEGIELTNLFGVQLEQRVSFD